MTTSQTHRSASQMVIDSASGARRSTIPGAGAMTAPGFQQNEFHGSVDWAKTIGLISFPVAKVELRGRPRRDGTQTKSEDVKRREYFRGYRERNRTRLREYKRGYDAAHPRRRTQ